MAKRHRVRLFLALAWYQLRTTLRRSSVTSWVVLFIALYVSMALVIEPLQAPLKLVGIEFPALTRYQITGTVRDSNLDPVPAVRVVVGGYSTTTDPSGAYNLRFPADSPQGVAIVFTDGSADAIRLVDIDADNSLRVDVTLR